MSLFTVMTLEESQQQCAHIAFDVCFFYILFDLKNLFKQNGRFTKLTFVHHSLLCIQNLIKCLYLRSSLNSDEFYSVLLSERDFKTPDLELKAVTKTPQL